jgi:hypothetical protein
LPPRPWSRVAQWTKSLLVGEHTAANGGDELDENQELLQRFFRQLGQMIGACLGDGACAGLAGLQRPAQQLPDEGRQARFSMRAQAANRALS